MCDENHYVCLPLANSYVFSYYYKYLFKDFVFV